MMNKKDLGYLVVSSIFDMCYLSNYNLLAGAANVLIPLENEPILLIDQDWDLLRAQEVSAIHDTRATSDLAVGVPEIMKDTYVKGKIGVVG